MSENAEELCLDFNFALLLFNLEYSLYLQYKC